MNKILHRALKYPYTIPNTGFAYLSGKAYPMVVEKDNQLLVNGKEITSWLTTKETKVPERWIPIIAYGSNQSIAQLASKFPKNVPILGLPVEIQDFDVVRSAHFTTYGTIPATIIPSFGCSCKVFLTLMPQKQLTKMHRSELEGENYQFVEFPKNRLISPYTCQQVWVYTSMHGTLNLDGTPIAFKEIKANNRILPQITQPDLMQQIHKKLFPNLAFEQWIADIIKDKALRNGMSKALQSLTEPCRAPNFIKKRIFSKREVLDPTQPFTSPHSPTKISPTQPKPENLHNSQKF